MKHKDQIVILSVFIFISSSFLFFSKNDDKKVDFVKKPYKWIYDRHILGKFVDCSIRYLVDIGEIEISADFDEGGFNYYYRKQFLKPNNCELDLKKYSEMLDLVLQIHDLYKYEIPFRSKKVLDLIECLSNWKKLALELFRYRAEYILFSFILNLSR